MSRPQDEVTVAGPGISAFCHNENQSIINSNVEIAQRDIIHIEFNPQLPPSWELRRFINAYSDFIKAVNANEDIASPGLPHSQDESTKKKVNEENREDITENPKSAFINMIHNSDETMFPPTPLTQKPRSRYVYIRTLFPLGYGYPLWLPQVDRNLPLEYRKNGISIGDVGVIGLDGAFDFLFNIWLPCNHPINPNDLPNDFDRDTKPRRKTAFQTLFNPGYSTISNLDVNSYLDSSTGRIVISCKDGREGAIIAIPDGASEEDLKNERSLMPFISRNAPDWYRYAHNSGVDIRFDSLYLVTGCMKAKTWGIATFDKPISERNSLLIMEKINGVNKIPDTSYIWKQAEEATTIRIGPTYDGTQFSESAPGCGIASENQCLFLRGYKISLSWNEMQKILPEPPRVEINYSPPLAAEPDWTRMHTNGGTITFGPRRLYDLIPTDHIDDTSCNATATPLNAGSNVEEAVTGTLGDADRNNDTNLYDDSDQFASEYDVFDTTGYSSGNENNDTTTPPSPWNWNLPSGGDADINDFGLNTPSSAEYETIVHPSDALNDLLLSHAPEARTAITHDRIWNELRNYKAEEISEILQEHYVVCYYKDAGFCFLERKEDVHLAETDSEINEYNDIEHDHTGRSQCHENLSCTSVLAPE